MVQSPVRCCNPYGDKKKGHKYRPVRRVNNRWLCHACRRRSSRVGQAPAEQPHTPPPAVPLTQDGPDPEHDLQADEGNGGEDLEPVLESDGESYEPPLRDEITEVSSIMSETLGKIGKSPFDKKRAKQCNFYLDRKVQQLTSHFKDPFSRRKLNMRITKAASSRTATENAQSTSVTDEVIETGELDMTPSSIHTEEDRSENEHDYAAAEPACDKVAEKPAHETETPEDVCMLDSGSCHDESGRDDPLGPTHRSHQAASTTRDLAAQEHPLHHVRIATSTPDPQQGFLHLRCFSPPVSPFGECSQDKSQHECPLLATLAETYKAETDQYKKMSILVIAIASKQSDRQIAKLFSATTRTVAKARRLYQKSGILTQPDRQLGSRFISEADIEKVREFYLLDDVASRVLTGSKDFIEGMPKRVLLANINELYVEFKQRHPEAKIGLTKFYELKPKCCVYVGQPGTKSVCVCCIHQNPKLMMEGAKIAHLSKNSPHPLSSYSDCIATMVCDMNNPACRLGTCQNCPGTQPLAERLRNIFEENDIETVAYKQWQTTDRCAITINVDSAEEFIQTFLFNLNILNSHAFIAHQQTLFLQKKKEELGDDEVLVICDFSENYSFEVQDAVQGWHWNNSMATLHVAVVYYKHEGKLEHFNHVSVSESLTHNAAAVHLYQTRLAKEIKRRVGAHIKKVLYFTDGAPSQYKNKSTLLNLTHHEEDFAMAAEWHYFATSHGKNACDGIGGLVKRMAKRASLQGRLILTPRELYEFSVEHGIGNTVYELYTERDYKQHERSLKARFRRARLLPGTRHLHAVVPMGVGKVLTRRYSAAVESKQGNVQ